MRAKRPDLELDLTSAHKVRCDGEMEITKTIHNFKENLVLRAFSALKIPMIYFLNPKILQLDENTVRVRIKLSRRAKNHHGSMYFGALAVGADVAGGALAMKLIRESGAHVSFIFKDFSAQFFKRPEGDVEFVCSEGKKVTELVRTVIKSSERHNTTLNVVALVPSKFGTEPVAQFTLTLSLKKK
jgi:acyl-coenzyme A thioesterase PaaI-like protein